MSCGCTSNYTCSMCLCTDGINKANYREYVVPEDTGEPEEVEEEEEYDPTDEEYEAEQKRLRDLRRMDRAEHDRDRAKDSKGGFR